ENNVENNNNNNNNSDNNGTNNNNNNNNNNDNNGNNNSINNDNNSSSENEVDPDVAWKAIQTAAEIAVTSISDLNHRVTKNQWISSRSIALMDSLKLIPSGSEHDEERQQIRSRLSKSLRNDRKQWWATKAKEMEKGGYREHKTALQTNKRNWN
ncbi:unnamed protein product, partial [Schistosoma margrebowiei]